MHKHGYMYRLDTNMDNNHYWFWAYYNVKGIALDMRPSVAKTNLHQANPETFVTLDKITTQAHIWAGEPYMAPVWALWGEGWTSTPATSPLPYEYPGTPYVGTWGPWGLVTPNAFYSQDKEPAIEEYMGIYPVDWLKKLRFGSIYYENLGDNVTEFDIIVPVEIFYEWGSLKENIRWHVDTTHGHSPE